MRHSPFTAVYDACVLYPAPLRSFLMYLAVTDLYHARWTNDIHEEWMRNVVKDHADIPREQVERIRDLMNVHVRDCLVSGYESLIGGLSLPDPDDRHVLAAAILCGAANDRMRQPTKCRHRHALPHPLAGLCLRQQRGRSLHDACNPRPGFAQDEDYLDHAGHIRDQHLGAVGKTAPQPSQPQ